MKRRPRGRRPLRRAEEELRSGARSAPGHAAGPAAGLLLLTAVLVPWGCGGDRDGTDTLSDSVYVEVMARLVVLDSALSPAPETASGDRERADSLRTRILESWGVDADRLLDYARTRGGDPEGMEAVWSRVHELSDSLAVAGWTPPGAEAPGDTAGADADTGREADDASGPGAP